MPANGRRAQVSTCPPRLGSESRSLSSVSTGFFLVSFVWLSSPRSQCPFYLQVHVPEILGFFFGNSIAAFPPFTLSRTLVSRLSDLLMESIFSFCSTFQKISLPLFPSRVGGSSCHASNRVFISLDSFLFTASVLTS